TRFSRDWSSDVCSSDLLGSNTHERILHYELYESLAFDNFAFAKLSRKCPHALLDLAVKEPARAAPQTVGCELYTSFLIQQGQYSNFINQNKMPTLIRKNPLQEKLQRVLFKSLTMTYSHMGRRNTTIGAKS